MIKLILILINFTRFCWFIYENVLKFTEELFITYFLTEEESYILFFIRKINFIAQKITFCTYPGEFIAAELWNDKLCACFQSHCL